MPPQARLGDKAFIAADAHGCVACPHAATGPAVEGSPNVVWQKQLGYHLLANRVRLTKKDYEYVIEPGMRFNQYNMEAQGEILADYFALKFLRNRSVMRYQGDGFLSSQDYEKEVLVDFLSNPSDSANLPTQNPK